MIMEGATHFIEVYKIKDTDTIVNSLCKPIADLSVSETVSRLMNLKTIAIWKIKLKPR